MQMSPIELRHDRRNGGRQVGICVTNGCDKFYRVVVRLVLYYGSECWPIKNSQEQNTYVVEMPTLRYMSGSSSRTGLVKATSVG